MIADTVQDIVKNTRDYVPLTDSDLTSLNNIFGEIDWLLTRARIKRHQSCEEDFENQIRCISEIVCKNKIGMQDRIRKDPQNYRDGMIFQNYERLLEIIHRLNTEWNLLCSRGFSVKVFHDFWNFFNYSRAQGEEMNEDEKFETFMAILDGTMKFVPVYEHKPVCLKPVANSFKGEIVKTIENKYSKPYRLRQNEESISQHVTNFKK